MSLTAGELRRAIAQVSDDTPVIVLDTWNAQEHPVEDVSTSLTVTLEICAR